MFLLTRSCLNLTSIALRAAEALSGLCCWEKIMHYGGTSLAAILPHCKPACPLYIVLDDAAGKVTSLGLCHTFRNAPATDWSACAGHGSNQSMVQLFTNAGKFLHRRRKSSPTGDMASTMCRLRLHRSANAFHKASLVTKPPCSATCTSNECLEFSELMYMSQWMFSLPKPCMQCSI